MSNKYKEIIESEGNRKTFNYKGYECLILRTNPETSGHLCGYVKVENEYCYDEYSQFGIDVHGGFTFSGNLLGEKGIWLGFDCSHARDIRPAYADAEKWERYGDTYKDMGYVVLELMTTVDQIIEKNFFGKGEYEFSHLEKTSGTPSTIEDIKMVFDKGGEQFRANVSRQLIKDLLNTIQKELF